MQLDKRNVELCYLEDSDTTIYDHAGNLLLDIYIRERLELVQQLTLDQYVTYIIHLNK